MPTTIDSAGITFNDATSLTSATIPANAVGATQIANGSVTAAKLGTDEQQQIAKAWAYFDIAAPVSRLKQFNISGITRTAAGSYTITFQTPMSDTNYALLISAASTTGATWNMPVYHYGFFTVNGFDVRLSSSNDTGPSYRDGTQLSIAVFS